MTSKPNPISDHLDLWTSALLNKSKAGRSSNGKQEAYGIKKLRELILELAVRGKLVPQDPNDTPATELLKEIKSEKQGIVKAGKIKAPKTRSDIEPNEIPYILPIGWEWVRLGNCCQVERGGSPRPIEAYLTNDADGLNWIKIGDTQKGSKFITSTREKIKKEGLVKTRKVYPGDFLLTNSMSFGRPYISMIEGCIHDGWLRIHPPTSLDKDYLYNLLQSPYVTRFFAKAAAGAVVQNLNADKVRELLIALPPFKEQKRIAAKVDELMALCDQLEQQQTDSIAAHQTLVQTLLDTLTQAADAAEFEQTWSRIADHFDTLFTNEPSIDQLKQTLLQLAVMGKLVPQDSNDEPADVLLEKLINKNENVPGKTKQQNGKVMQSIMAEEKSFDLPSSWCWVSLDELSPEYQNGASSRGDKSGKDIIVLRLADIDNWKVSLKNTRTLTITEHSIAKYSLQTNDILIIRVNGSADIVGRFILCEEKYDAIYCDHFIRMRFQHEVLIPSYLVLLGLSDLVRNRINQLFISTAGQKTVNQKHIGSLVVSVPPLAEQHRIVAKVDELMTLCDALKARIAAAQTTQLQLADVIVEQAVT